MGLVRSKECMQMLVTRPRNYSLNWLLIIEVEMFVRLWNPGRLIVAADIEANAVVSDILSGLDYRERVLLIYLGTTPSLFAVQFNSRALFQ